MISSVNTLFNPRNVLLCSMIVLFMSTIHYKVNSCDKDKIVCHTVCVQDGDDIGVIINSKCYCGNARDVSKVILKLNRDFKGQILIDPPNEE